MLIRKLTSQQTLEPFNAVYESGALWWDRHPAKTPVRFDIVAGEEPAMRGVAHNPFIRVVERAHVKIRPEEGYDIMAERQAPHTRAANEALCVLAYADTQRGHLGYFPFSVYDDEGKLQRGKVGKAVSRLIRKPDCDHMRALWKNVMIIDVGCEGVVRIQRPSDAGICGILVFNEIPGSPRVKLLNPEEFAEYTREFITPRNSNGQRRISHR